ncbi:hypothetical protein D3C74_48820 [compost metagenome]
MLPSSFPSYNKKKLIDGDNMKTNERISFAKIGEEIYKESKQASTVKYDNPDDLKDYIKSYVKERRDSFIDILKFLGADPNVLKRNGGYYLPVTQKDNIKQLINLHNVPTALAFRRFYKEFKKKNKKNKLTKNEKVELQAKFKVESAKFITEELETMVHLVENIFKESLDDTQFHQQMERVYTITRVNIRRATNEIYDTLLPFIKKELDDLLPFWKKYEFNDEDKVVILNYYRNLILGINSHFKEIVNLANEIRGADIADISWVKNLPAGTDLDSVPLSFKSSEELLAEAIREYNMESARSNPFSDLYEGDEFK